MGMDREDPANGRRMTQEEVAKKIAFALRLHVSHVKVGRVTFAEAVDRGFPLLARKLAECLYPHIIFVKKPPHEWHGRFEA